MTDDTQQGDGENTYHGEEDAGQQQHSSSHHHHQKKGLSSEGFVGKFVSGTALDSFFLQSDIVYSKGVDERVRERYSFTVM